VFALRESQHGEVLTIHGLALKAVVAVILGQEELEVRLWIFDASDLVILVDKIAVGYQL
jgi:hypothetical protein